MPLSEYKELHGGGFHVGKSGRTPGWETLAGRQSAPQEMSYRTGHTGTWEDRQQDLGEYVQRKQDEYRYEQEDTSLHGMLSHAMRPGGEGFTGHVHLSTQFGTSGKPQVAGAHHRIASMADIDPERLLPVVHHKSMTAARGGFAEHKYT